MLLLVGFVLLQLSLRAGRRTREDPLDAAVDPYGAPLRAGAGPAEADDTPEMARRPSGPTGGEGVLMGYFEGFGVTGRKFLRGFVGDDVVTVEYPEHKRAKPVRFHGRHVLNRYEDGMEKCIGCELCAGVCPARCIYVRGADNDPEEPTSPGERYGFVYEINYLRCIHCDLCVEACPTEAITESKLFEFAFTNRADAIYTKDELLVDDDGQAPPAALGALGAGRGRAHLGLDAGHLAERRRRLRGPGGLVGRAGLRRAPARAGPARRPGRAARGRRRRGPVERARRGAGRPHAGGDH